MKERSYHDLTNIFLMHKLDHLSRIWAADGLLSYDKTSIVVDRAMSQLDGFTHDRIWEILDANRLRETPY